MGDPILSMSSMTVQFGGVRACDSIDMEIERGELFALIGPNGAGKTTLVNSVTGIYVPRPDASIDFHPRSGGDVDLLSLRPFEIARSGVARTFQNLGLFQSENLLTNLMLGRYTHEKTGVLSGGLFSRRAVRNELRSREAIEQIIDLLQLGEYRRDLVGELPYGVQKRIELGRVLVMEPELLMLDEPMAGMSVDEKRDMVGYIFDIRAALGTTVLLIEHDMGVVMAIADRVMVIESGERIALGGPAEVQQDEHVISAYLGTA